MDFVCHKIILLIKWNMEYALAHLNLTCSDQLKLSLIVTPRLFLKISSQIELALKTEKRPGFPFE